MLGHKAALGTFAMSCCEAVAALGSNPQLKWGSPLEERTGSARSEKHDEEDAQASHDAQCGRYQPAHDHGVMLERTKEPRAKEPVGRLGGWVRRHVGSSILRGNADTIL